MQNPINDERALKPLAITRGIPAPTRIQADLAAVVAAGTRTRRRRSGRGRLTGLAVAAATTGLLTTVAVPAYAAEPVEAGMSTRTAELTELTRSAAQTLSVPATAVVPRTAGEDYAVVTGDAIRAEQAAAEAAAAAQAAAAEAARQAEAAAAASVASVASAPATGYSLDAVYQTALQYVGTPYVFAGATPAGFDCSGLVQYVFGQFGISMPHSVSGQAAMGTTISINEAVPGDLIVMDGHIGFYAGGGNILHAPYEGASVRVQALWTSDYSVVRING